MVILIDDVKKNYWLSVGVHGQFVWGITPKYVNGELTLNRKRVTVKSVNPDPVKSVVVLRLWSSMWFHREVSGGGDFKAWKCFPTPESDVWSLKIRGRGLWVDLRVLEIPASKLSPKVTPLCTLLQWYSNLKNLYLDIQCNKLATKTLNSLRHWFKLFFLFTWFLLLVCF